MLFRDRLRVFPTSKPLHEMTDDDYVAFAIAWKNLHPTTHATPTRPVAQTPVPVSRPVMHPPPQAPPPPSSLRPSSMQAPIHNMATPNLASNNPSFSTLAVFSTPHPIFHGRLRIMQVDGDGNCLFRALLRAAGHIDANHLELQRNCVDVIVQNWEDYTHQANAIHQTAPAFATLTNEPFPTKESYATYMSCPGHWGLELEAVVCAKFLQQPLLIWAIADGSQLHPLMNYSPTARIFTQTIIHISYSGLHYNALIHDSDQTSLLLSQQVFNSINNPTHAATPSCHSHPTGPSHTSHSEHPPCTSDRRHFVRPKRPTIAKALKSCAHDKISPRASRPLVPDSTRRQRPPSIHPQRTRRQKLTISTHAFTCRSTKFPDPSNTLNPDSPRSATKQLHRRSQSQLRFGTDAHRVKRRRQALDSDASV
jgi:hypothetical protein